MTEIRSTASQLLQAVILVIVAFLPSPASLPVLTSDPVTSTRFFSSALWSAPGLLILKIATLHHY